MPRPLCAAARVRRAHERRQGERDLTLSANVWVLRYRPASFGSASQISRSLGATSATSRGYAPKPRGRSKASAQRSFSPTAGAGSTTPASTGRTTTSGARTKKRGGPIHKKPVTDYQTVVNNFRNTLPLEIANRHSSSLSAHASQYFCSSGMNGALLLRER